MQQYFYKLTEKELRALVPAAVADKIVAKALERKPGQYLPSVVRHYLNKAESIWVQNVHFYGGEHFNKPYAFVAEICHATTGSCFSRWRNSLPKSGPGSCPSIQNFGRIAFTY
jgi:hypothetical protein